MEDVSECFLQKLDEDTIIHMLGLLDTPNDLAHAACVCRSWRGYVTEGNLWRKLCMKIFPEIGTNFKCISNGYSHELSSNGPSESECLEAGNSLYGLLLCKLQSPPAEKTCICEPLHASSTDNLPQESVAQTLYPRPVYPDEETPSYWSSKGQRSSHVPERLTYRLVSDLCVVHHIQVQPFSAFFQPGEPIYSAQMIRFRLGYTQSMQSRWSGLFDCLSEMPKKVDMDDYVWTYESPAFSMAQEDTLQTFELPKPTLCIGGIFQIELMGRVQTQQTDGLFYICVSHVNVSGRPLSDFKFEGIDKDGQYVLKHFRKREKCSSATLSPLEQNVGAVASRWFAQPERSEQIRSIRVAPRNRLLLEIILRNLLVAGLLTDDEEFTDDEEDDPEDD